MLKLNTPKTLGPLVHSIQVDSVTTRTVYVAKNPEHPDGIHRIVQLSWQQLDETGKPLASGLVAQIVTKEEQSLVFGAMASGDPIAVAETLLKKTLDS
jgi:hypothetical protein